MKNSRQFPRQPENILVYHNVQLSYLTASINCSPQQFTPNLCWRSLRYFTLNNSVTLTNAYAVTEKRSLGPHGEQNPIAQDKEDNETSHIVITHWSPAMIVERHWKWRGGWCFFPHLSWNLSSLYPHAPLLTGPHPYTSALGPRRLQISPEGRKKPLSNTRCTWSEHHFLTDEPFDRRRRVFFLCDYVKAWYVFKVLWTLHCLAPVPEDETKALLLLLSVTGQTCSRALKTQGQRWAPLKLWESEYCWQLLNSWKQEFSVNLACKCQTLERVKV